MTVRERLFGGAVWRLIPNGLDVGRTTSLPIRPKGSKTIVGGRWLWSLGVECSFAKLGRQLK